MRGTTQVISYLLAAPSSLLPSAMAEIHALFPWPFLVQLTLAINAIHSNCHHQTKKHRPLVVIKLKLCRRHYLPLFSTSQHHLCEHCARAHTLPQPCHIPPTLAPPRAPLETMITTFKVPTWVSSCPPTLRATSRHQIVSEDGVQCFPRLLELHFPSDHHLTWRTDVLTMIYHFHCTASRRDWRSTTRDWWAADQAPLYRISASTSSSSQASLSSRCLIVLLFSHVGPETYQQLKLAPA